MTKYFKRKIAVRSIKKTFIYGLLKERLNEAIGNSRRLEQENKQSGKKKGTSSQVYRIIESLEL